MANGQDKPKQTSMAISNMDIMPLLYHRLKTKKIGTREGAFVCYLEVKILEGYQMFSIQFFALPIGLLPAK